MPTQAHRKSEGRLVVDCDRTIKEAKTLARQQAAVARLGQLALTGGGLSSLMDEATAVVARTLRVEYCKVLELLPNGQAFLLRAGVGWKEGCVGRAQVGTQADSQAGYTLLSKYAVVTENLSKEKRFTAPPLLVEHNVNSGVSVIIFGRERPFGILGAHATQKRKFSKDDVNFVQAIANVLATAIERKQSEEALQQQAQILDQIHDSVISTDLDGVVTSWNRGATRLFGYSNQEAVGRHISFVYREDQRKFLEQEIIRPLKKKGVHEVEVKMRKKSGEEFYAHLSLSLLRDSSNEVVGMVGYSMDITKRKKAEQDLGKVNLALQHEITERKLAEMVAHGHTQILLRTLDALTTEPDLGKFLDELLIALTQELKAHSCALWFHDLATRSNTLYKTSHAGRVLTGDQQLGYPHASQPAHIKTRIAEKSRDKKPFVLENVGKSHLLEPELRAWMAAHRVKLLLCIPLLFRDKVIGTLTIREARRDHFTPQEIRLAQALAHHVSLALHLIRLADEGQKSAILQERNRVAREMHDTLGQGFTGILVQLEAAEDVLAENRRLALGHLKRARDLARESLAEARRSVWALRPQSLEGADLVTALRHLAYQMTVGKRIKVDFSLQGAARPLPPETEVHLLRIAQEALTNALKHGRASLVSIGLAFNAGGVQLSVQDNGRGFSEPRGTPNGGFGRVSLRERAQQMGAKVTVRSQPGLGTRVVARVPTSSLLSTEITS